MGWQLRTGAILAVLLVATPCLGQTVSPRASSRDSRESEVGPPDVRQLPSPAGGATVGEEAAAADGSGAHQLPSPEVRSTSDPFTYRTPSGGGAFVPASIDLPTGIGVMGILVLESGDSLAALRLPGEEGLQYVTEDEDVPIRASSRHPRGTPATSRDDATETPGIFYLRINRITPQHVEVYPEHSPTNIQILR